jgi:FixJ family two-component response regulator
MSADDPSEAALAANRPIANGAPAPREAAKSALSVDQVLDGLAEGFFALDADWRFVAFNRAAEDIFELAREQAPGELLTDVVMPGDMNGRELADDAVRLRNGLRVLFMTGYSRDAIIRHGRLDAGVHVIGKPFSFDDLAAKVRERLDAAE